MNFGTSVKLEYLSLEGRIDIELLGRKEGELVNKIRIREPCESKRIRAFEFTNLIYRLSIC